VKLYQATKCTLKLLCKEEEVIFIVIFTEWFLNNFKSKCSINMQTANNKLDYKISDENSYLHRKNILFAEVKPKVFLFIFPKLKYYKKKR